MQGKIEKHMYVCGYIGKLLKTSPWPRSRMSQAFLGPVKQKRFSTSVLECNLSSLCQIWCEFPAYKLLKTDEKAKI